MMVETTHRMALPLIVPGQAQKEMTHNEALALIDMALHASVVAVGIDTLPSDPEVGDCWIVGDAPTGAWAGHAAHMAGWTAGGWRFSPPMEGMAVAVLGGGTARFRRDGGWNLALPSAIAAPAGGDVVDLAARSAIAAILGTLRAHGMVFPA